MPSLLVRPKYCTRVASFTTVISASATTACAGSKTKPLMVPLGDWPRAESTKPKPRIQNSRTAERRCMLVLLTSRYGHACLVSGGDPKVVPFEGDEDPSHR